MTLKDVAREAGVSLTTVSLVLSNKGRISQSVRERVILVAERLRYKKIPDRTFERGTSGRTIGILLEVDQEWEFAWTITRSIIFAINRVLENSNRQTIILPINLSQAAGDIYRNVLSTDTNAVFSIHYGNKILFERLEEIGVPVVIINNSNFQDRFYSVCVDDFQGAYEGALHLLKFGHRKIVYVDFDRPDMPALVSDRFVGFKKAIDEYGIEFSDRRHITTDLSNMQDLDNKLGDFFRGASPPTAIFAHDDYLAANVIAVLKKQNIQAPRDVSIIAPGDVLNYSQPYVPQISTMRINTELMGTTAAELMLKILGAKPDGVHVLKVNQQLFDRGSCRKINSAR